MNFKEIAPFLEKEYNLGKIVSQKIIRDGIDNKVYDISIKNGDRFVVRESKRNFKYKNLDFEIELNDFLNKKKL